MADIAPRKGSPTQFALYRLLTGGQLFFAFLFGTFGTPGWLTLTGAVAALPVVVGWRRRVFAGILLIALAAIAILQPEYPRSSLVILMVMALLLAVVPEGEPFAVTPSRGSGWGIPPIWMTVAELALFGGGWFCAYVIYRDGSPQGMWHSGFFCHLLVIATLAIDARWIHPKFSAEPPVVFFDGVCGLCSNFVDWLFAEDANEIFRVSALQSEYAARTLDATFLSPEVEAPTSIVLKDETGVYNKSTAVLRIAAKLGGILRWVRVFELVPRFIRDGVYDFVAQNRYKWFGKKETCRLPTKEERKRFLL